MTSVAVPPGVIKKTQSELGKFVKKPPLTDKLLNKPPFRFLHDIINVIITETGFLEGLFTDIELSSDSIKDKDSKVAFLQKCIDATSLVIGEQVNVRPNKVVAGHEAEKTNEWLQALAAAIEAKVDTREAVSQILSGAKPGKPKKDKEKDKDKDKEKDKEHKKSERKEREKKESRSKDEKDKERSSRKEKDKDRDKSSKREKEKGKAEDGDKKERRSKDKERRTKDKDKDDKENKEKRRSKTEAVEGSPEKTKSAKSGSRSRSSRSKESGKENSPPQEQIEDNTNIPNDQDQESAKITSELDLAVPQHDLLDVSANKLKGQLGRTGGLSGRQNPSISRAQSRQGSAAPPRPKSTRPSSTRTGGVNAALEDGGIGSGGPTSLGVEDNGQPKTEQIGIDPAILKAMAPDQIGGALIDLNGGDPSDSGVGSLDSPKDPHVLQAGTSGGDLAPGLSSGTVTAPTAPGPQPLRAMEHFVGDGEAPAPVAPPLAQHQPHSETSEPRPKTGMGIRPRTALRSARPPSARPAPPRVRERREIPQEEQQRPTTSKPVANVILSSSQDLDDDDAFTVEESKPILEDDPVVIEPSGSGSDSNNAAALAAAAAGEEGAGLLVAQIMETKKELEDGRRAAFSPETPGHRRVPIEQSMLSDASRRKERQIIQKDVQQLSGSIQNITRSVNPLDKQHSQTSRYQHS